MAGVHSKVVVLECWPGQPCAPQSGLSGSGLISRGVYWCPKIIGFSTFLSRCETHYLQGVSHCHNFKVSYLIALLKIKWSFVASSMWYLWKQNKITEIRCYEDKPKSSDKIFIGKDDDYSRAIGFYFHCMWESLLTTILWNVFSALSGKWLLQGLGFGEKQDKYLVKQKHSWDVGPLYK